MTFKFASVPQFAWGSWGQVSPLLHWNLIGGASRECFCQPGMSHLCSFEAALCGFAYIPFTS